MEPSKPLLQVQHLSKYFPIYAGVLSRTIGHVRAVEDVSFTISEGEIFGLVGESGCGKTTTGRTVLNLLKPTAGRVVFDDMEIFNVAEHYVIANKAMQALRQQMQIVFQDPYASLDPRMNVGAIISEGILKHKLCGKKEALDRARELLKLCDMPDGSMRKYPHEFSGGQRQRIGIARALALNPRFIVGDEPIAALDVSVQAQVLSLLQNLIELFHLTTLFISHDLGVIRYFCDRVGVMYLGSFVEIASSSELFRSPIHPYTQALLSSMPKQVPSEVREKIILEGDVPSPANPPGGCKFHTRCKYVMDICKQQSPELIQVSKESQVACHLCDVAIIKERSICSG